MRVRWKQPASVVLLAGAVLGAPVPAEAAWDHNAPQCHFSSRTIRYYGGLGPTWAKAANDAAAAWSDSEVNISNAPTTSPQIRVSSGWYGNNGSAGRTYWGSCSNNHWTSSPEVQINLTYATGYGDLKRKAVMSHEFGHALGLGHVIQNCNHVMVEATSILFACETWGPKPGDKAGINAIY